MKRIQKLQHLQHLQRLQAEIDELRRELAISAPGAVLYFSSSHTLEDETVVVEADGLGGAITRVVEGNYPLDYVINFEEKFTSEEDAECAAEGLVNKGRYSGAT